MNTLLRISLLLAAAHSLATGKDVHETQLEDILRIREEKIREVNLQTVPGLHALLDKAVASKNKPAEIKVRQWLVDIGHPHPEDWLLGTWNVRDGDGMTRTYQFTAAGQCEFLARNGKKEAWMKPGTISELTATSAKVVTSDSIMTIEKTDTGIRTSKWDAKDYPNPKKALTGAAKR